MNAMYQKDPNHVLKRFDQWWAHANQKAPLMKIVARNGAPADMPVFPTVESRYLDVELLVQAYRAYCASHTFLAESFPSLSLDLGPGSMALYLGGEPRFAEDTVWYKEMFEDASAFDTLRYDAANPWFQKHLAMVQKAKALANNDFLINIPDIIENLDILAALRGPQDLCYDLVDEPEAVLAGVQRVDDSYFRYYDAFYDLVKGQDGSSSFTAFYIWGSGRIAKIQCDFSALISTDDFRRYVQPSLRKQCERLDHTLYHLDGPDAIRHLDAVMEIETLDALQWTCGAGQPDGACERWYPIYDKVSKAGKSLWIQIEDGDMEQWLRSAQRLISLYGMERLYLLFPEFADVNSAKDFIRALGGE